MRGARKSSRAADEHRCAAVGGDKTRLLHHQLPLLAALLLSVVKIAGGCDRQDLFQWRLVWVRQA
jgi:hypothetical protein